MPRSIWKGAISFGLVTIPVKLFSATEEKDIAFRQVHAEDGGRIKYKRVCTVCGEEVAFSDIAKGFELPSDPQEIGAERMAQSALAGQSPVAHATQPKYEYRHKWRDGDMVIWDNRSVMHQANGDYAEKRYLLRLMVKGVPLS